ncbi:MAG: cytochrome c biogenesis protein ResB [Verrucomicrobiae bacterium]|nr:cytochrome c biogenesis protein ResB [Verrucomicrobiae bacterium]
MTFAVVLLTLLAVAALVGVMLPDQDAAQRWIYHAKWFQGILGFLILDLVLALCTHRDRTWRYLAYFGTHGGLIAVLLGFAVMGYLGTEGYLDVPLGGTASKLGQLQPVAPSAENRDPDPSLKAMVPSGRALPFEVRLDKFDIEYYPRPFPVLVCGVSDQKKTDQVQLDAPKLGDPRYRIEVLEKLVSAKRTYRVENQGQVPTNPALKIRLLVGDRPTEGYLFSDRPAIPVSEKPLVVVDYDALPDSGSFQQKVAETARSLRRSIEWTNEEEHASFELPLRLNEDIRVGPAGWKFRILRIVPGVQVDLQNHTIKELTGAPTNPAAYLRITAPDGRTQERYVFVNPPPPMMEARLRGEFQHLKLRLNFVPELGQELYYFYLASLPDGSFQAVSFEPAGPKITQLKPGQLARISGPVGLQILEFLPDPLIQSKVEPAPDGEGGGEPAVRVKMSGPLGDQEKWLILGDDQAVFYQDGNFSARYIQPEPAIRQFFATVTILDQGREAAHGVISVNSPLKYKGYSLYQVDYDQKAGPHSRYSILKAVRNPGAPLLYFGFVLLGAGVVGMVITQPKLYEETDVEVGPIPEGTRDGQPA